VIPDLERRRALLTAALGFALVDTQGKRRRRISSLSAAWDALTKTRIPPASEPTSLP
jgi:hypothetical protein